MKYCSTKNIAHLAALGTLLTIAGCSHPEPRPPFAPSGYLEDYSKLQPSNTIPSALVYVNKDKRLSLYKMVIIDPVEVRLQPFANKELLSEGELKKLAREFESRITSAVEGNYMIVSKPGFGVVRIRAAITDIIPEAPSPYFSDQSNSHSLFTGNVEEAAVEAELLDSQTGEQLAAFADSRNVDDCDAGPGLQRFGDADNCLNSWAVLLRDHLDQARGLHTSDTYHLLGSPLR